MGASSRTCASRGIPCRLPVVDRFSDDVLSVTGPVRGQPHFVLGPTGPVDVRRPCARSGAPRPRPPAEAVQSPGNECAAYRTLRVCLRLALPAQYDRDPIDHFACAPVAQLDRAPAFEAVGRGFESLRARQFYSRGFAPRIPLHAHSLPLVRPSVGRSTFVSARRNAARDLATCAASTSRSRSSLPAIAAS